MRLSRPGLQSPRASPSLARRPPPQSLCKEHSWGCVSTQRPVRLGFRVHAAGEAAELGVVRDLGSLCVAACCLATNTRLFGCVAACCWGRVELADRRCGQQCCGAAPGQVSRIADSGRIVIHFQSIVEHRLHVWYPLSYLIIRIDDIVPSFWLYILLCHNLLTARTRLQSLCVSRTSRRRCWASCATRRCWR